MCRNTYPYGAVSLSIETVFFRFDGDYIPDPRMVANVIGATVVQMRCCMLAHQNGGLVKRPKLRRRQP